MLDNRMQQNTLIDPILAVFEMREPIHIEHRRLPIQPRTGLRNPTLRNLTAIHLRIPLRPNPLQKLPIPTPHIQHTTIRILWKKLPIVPLEPRIRSNTHCPNHHPTNA